MPTAYEITQFCPALTSEDIEERLDGLIEKDIVEAVRLAPADRQDDSPDTFYGVTDYGWRFLMYHNLLESEGIVLRWQDVDIDDPTSSRWQWRN